MKKVKKFWVILGITVIIWGMAFLSYHSIAPGPNNSDFSVDNALKHVAQMAANPHPTGSKANSDISAYIEKEISALGLKPELQKTDLFSEEEGIYAHVQNVMTRIPGTGGGQAILVDAHYDGVKDGPGASDNIAQVAAALEVMLHIKPHTLVNDVIFLFSDGEEMSLLGTRAFMKEHPWKDSVDFVLNFDCRGTDGSLLMYETTPGDYKTISSFASKFPGLYTNSMLVEGYRTMPNDTDYTVYREKGIQGLNFAYIGSGYRYHSMLDNLQNVNADTLSETGNTMLKTVELYGNKDLRALYQNQDSVFFSLFNKVLIAYPAWVNYLMLIAALILLLLALYRGFKRERFKMWPFVLGFIAQVFLPAIFFFLYDFLAIGLQWINPEAYIKFSRDFYQSLPAFIGMLLVVFGLFFLLYRWLERNLGHDNLAGGRLLVWAVLFTASTVLMPGAAYLFAFGLLAEGIVINLSLKGNHGFNRLVSYIPFWIFSFFWIPIVMLFGDAFGMFKFGLPGVLFILLLSFLMPGWVSLVKKGWIVVITCVILSGFLFVVDAKTDDVSAELNWQMLVDNHSTTVYYVNSIYEGQEQVFWDAWGPHAEPFKNMNNSNASFKLPQSELTLEKAEDKENGRVLEIRVKPLSTDLVTSLTLDNANGNILSASINGEFPVRCGEKVELTATGVGQEGFMLILTTKDKSPVSIDMTENGSGEVILEGTEVLTTFEQLTKDIGEPFLFRTFSERIYSY